MSDYTFAEFLEDFSDETLKDYYDYACEQWINCEQQGEKLLQAIVDWNESNKEYRQIVTELLMEIDRRKK